MWWKKYKKFKIKKKYSCKINNTNKLMTWKKNINFKFIIYSLLFINK
jgi:hypothetical protein